MKLLIANRGEIAVRIIRGCREMGINTVAVYSEVDRRAPHVLMADQSFPIGPAEASKSYLNVDRLLEVASASGADLLHPGYGFLAENADFAERVEAAGVTWVGPPPAAMRLMGSKTESRKLAVACGVPLIPGLMEPIREISELEAFVDEHGLPVLLKAVAGGGGKGMRAVSERGELANAWERACSEGQAYFGDPRVYVERLVDRARHVEIQVAADRDGNAVYVGERECSIQRRHQKVVEECPSPVVGPDLRHRLGEAALTLVRASGYYSVGTVEFLLDPDRSFLFSRDEHPVAGGAPGDRGGLRRRPGRRTDQSRPRQAVVAAAGGPGAQGPRDRVPDLRRRPIAQLCPIAGKDHALRAARGPGGARGLGCYHRQRGAPRLRSHVGQARGVGAGPRSGGQPVESVLCRSTR